MKKIYILTAVLALLTLSLNAQITKQVAYRSAPTVNNGIKKAPSRAATTVTVCEGTQTNSYVPIYSYYYNDNYQINQMIYPESLLTDLVGKTITSLTFYANNNITLSGGQGNIKIGTTTNSSYSSATRITAGMSTYASYTSINDCISGQQLVFNLSTNYVYNGGNLVIEFQSTSMGSSYQSLSFLGITRSNASYYSRSSYSSTPTSGSRANFLPKLTFGYVDTTPRIEVSPETLTINDSGTNNTFTVEGVNLGTDDVGVTVPQGSEFLTTTDDQSWGFENNNGSVSGTVTVTYNGRALSATETVTAANNKTSATVTVNYRADLYIVGDFGNGWDFSTGTPMIYNSDNNTYTATVTVDDGNYILFARKLVNNEPWGTRLVFGPSSSGNWVLNGDEGNGNLNLYDNRPIEIVTGGTYTVTINATDNTFTIKKLVLPPPENVVATPDSENQKATVTWNAPSNLPTVVGTVYKSVTEGFDDTSKFPSFSLGGITATKHNGEVGGWTLYDSTGEEVWPSSDAEWEHEGEPQAWQVYNGAIVNETAENPYPTARSGDQYMESICPLDASIAADSWLISPELSGNAQTITFYERAISSSYTETYRILYSTTDNNPSSFTLATQAQQFTTSASNWTEHQISLPAGTKYLAICHISQDKWGLMIDDVTYEIASIGEVTLNPVSYNIYLDGVLVGNVSADQALTYTFNNLAAGDHEFAVSAVYEVGESVFESTLVPAQFTIIGRTATPTITVVPGENGSKIISATGDGDVHLYVDGVEVSNPYTIYPSPDGDMAYTVTATAKEEGKLISETAEQIVTVAEGGRTPAPAIIVEEHNGYVVITAYGDGTVTLNVDGQEATGEGSASITIVKSTEEQEVTAEATAQDGDLLESRPTTKEVTIHALNTTPTNPASGLLRLHLLMVDQMKQDIPADNSHPDRYSYILRYEPNGVGGTGTKESGTVHVDIQKADCEVMGAYTLTEVDNDKNIGSVVVDDNGNVVVDDNGNATINHDQGITMNVISADVEYDLSSDNDILYAYLLQGAENRLPGYQADYLTELQKTQNFTYVEMEESNPNKGTEYPNGEHHYFVGTKNPETGVYENLKTGAYGSSFMSYAPSVSTWGISRRYYEDDGYDNTYGAPIWKTGVGKVTMDASKLKAERQQNAWNSVNWTTDAGPASLFILDGFKATGLLPKTTVATVQYEPYMFRIFVESPSGKLRPYKTVADANGNGEHLEAADEITEADMYGPKCVWSGYIQYDEDGEIIGTDAANKVTVGYAPDDDDPTQTAYTYTKDKVDRPGGSSNGGVGNQDWDQDSNNAMFGALDAIVPANGGKISTNDLKVFVRFYYAVKGEIASHTVVRGEGSRSGNGAESEGSPAGPSNSVFEISYHGEVVGQTYYNVQGMESDKPFDGVNIVVTRYSDGTTTTTKVVR